MRTSAQIKAEIEEKVGFFPSFFAPAMQSPPVLENLWQQTLVAYIDNPLPSLFKEKLFAYLSRYCAVPYCLVCHSCTLYSLGMTAQEILKLIESPLLTIGKIEEHLSVLSAQPVLTLSEMPSVVEESLLYCAVYIFLEPEHQHYQAELCSILGISNHYHLVTYIAYIKVSQMWTEAHPEIAYETDLRTLTHLNSLLEQEPGLIDFFGNYRQKIADERLVEKVKMQASEQALVLKSVEELAKLNQLKDDFLSTVSHELRTPITNMRMAIHLLKAVSDPQRQEEYLEILETECIREARLINNLLDLQRLEAGYNNTILETVSLQEWLPRIIEPFRCRTISRQQTLQLHIPSNLPTLRCDRVSLERILAELLDNACKYTPDSGEINLSIDYDCQPAATSSSPVTIFTICNSTEIVAHELPYIFEKFYRVNYTASWEQGGTGLGLALVKKLTEQLQGTITVESSMGWTKFTVQLPIIAN